MILSTMNSKYRIYGPFLFILKASADVREDDGAFTMLEISEIIIENCSGFFKVLKKDGSEDHRRKLSHEDFTELLSEIDPSLSRYQMKKLISEASASVQ